MPKNKLWERLAALGLALALCLLLCVQGGLYRGNLQPAGTWLGARYDDVAEPVAARLDEPCALLTWELVECSRMEQAKILLNGREVADFTEASVVLAVRDGDKLELDVTAYARPVRVRLANCSQGVDMSLVKTEAEGCGELIQLGLISLT